jgi:hypothetical protein
MAAAIRARWHQLLKLNCVSDENSRDSVRTEVPTSLASVSISWSPVGSASTMSAARRQRGSRGSGMKVAESSAWSNSIIASRSSSAVRPVAAIVEQARIV